MRILVLSKDCRGLGIAHQIVKEGHEVDFFARRVENGWSGHGIVSRVHSWRPYVAKADLVVCASSGFGLQGALIRKMGKPVLACDLTMDAVGEDKRKESAMLKALKIDIPETFEFDAAEKAKELMEAWQGPGYLVGARRGQHSREAYIAHSKESFRHILFKLGRSLPIFVQRLVDGVEVSTEGWWNGRGWIEPFTHSFRESRLFSGGLGPVTSGMGNLVIAARRRNRLVKATVEKLEPFLKKTSYRGPVSIDTVVSEKGTCSYKVAAEFSYDATEAMMEGLSEPVTDVLFETAMSVKKRFEITEEFMISVRLSVPPWPGELPKEERGAPIEGLMDKNIRHLFLLDVYKEGSKYRCGAGDGVILKSTARGANIREAKRRAYRTLEGIHVANKQYRMDIGDRVSADMAKLTEWGYL